MGPDFYGADDSVGHSTTKVMNDVANLDQSHPAQMSWSQQPIGFSGGFRRMQCVSDLNLTDPLGFFRSVWKL